MKARIKETNSEFKEITGIMVEGNVIYPIGRVEFDSEPKPTHGIIDLEQRRFELVKAAMQGLFGNSAYFEDVCNVVNDRDTFEVMALDVRKLADAVLAEYRKGDKQ